MDNLKSGEGILTMTIQIKRKATGLVEEYQLTGAATPEQAQEVAEAVNLPLKEKQP